MNILREGGFVEQEEGVTILPWSMPCGQKSPHTSWSPRERAEAVSPQLGVCTQSVAFCRAWIWETEPTSFISQGHGGHLGCVLDRMLPEGRESVHVAGVSSLLS